MNASQITVEDSPEHDSTIPFMPVLKAIARHCPRPLNFWFSADLPTDRLLHVWDHQKVVDHTVESTPEHAIILQPNPGPSDPTTGLAKVMCFVEAGTLTLVHPTEHSMHVLRELHGTLHDQFGPLGAQQIDAMLIVTSEPLPPSIDIHAAYQPMILAALQACTRKCMADQANHAITYVFSGTSVQLQTIHQFWQHVMTPDLLTALALQSRTHGTGNMLAFTMAPPPCMLSTVCNTM